MTAAICILPHRCVCCQRRIYHTLIVRMGCLVPTMDFTCQDCSDSEGEGAYCWYCNKDGR
jgi:hypothetical protein